MGEEIIFCGVEGGASVSHLILITAKGKKLCEFSGPPLNYRLESVDICQKRIIGMLREAKKKANLTEGTTLFGLSLCLTGCEDERANKEFLTSFLKLCPNAAKHYVVASDTVAALCTTCQTGGLILIAGTGSNALLVNSDASTIRCGGWGHLIGDEASAMWISLKAVKTVFDHEDNLLKSPYDITKVKEIMCEHFGVEDKFGVLDHCYAKFKKPVFAGLCVKLAKAANEDNDPLCTRLFEEAGSKLADMVAAISPMVSKDILSREGGLPIVCVGSVFKSWNLLKPGFESNPKLQLREYTMLKLNCSAAIGAAYFIAKKHGYTFPINFKENSSVLFHFKKKNIK